jgi:hypothetical protein
LGAARHIFTLHIIESEHLTPHAKKRVKGKIEKVCLFVQEKAKFKVYKREPDEIVYRENSTKLSSRKNRTRRIIFKEVPKNYLQGGPEKLSSRRSRRIILKEVSKNYLQRGPEELSSKRTRRNFPEGGTRRNFHQGGTKKKGGQIFGFIDSSYCSEQEHR